MFSTIIDVTRT